MTNLLANWPAPNNIRALTTQKIGGVSQGLFASNNLALHVSDDPAHVLANRLALKTILNLPGEPEWLEQTHSTKSVVVEDESNRVADASITRDPSRVLAIMTADCLPILLCNKQGSEIAAIHAGWRGLVNGIVENTVSNMHSRPTDLLAWIGPAICSACYQVGAEVYDAYINRYPFAKYFFAQYRDKWYIDLAGIADAILGKSHVSAVYHAKVCTFEYEKDYYSYRREAQTGRIASLIWFNTNQD